MQLSLVKKIQRNMVKLEKWTRAGGAVEDSSHNATSTMGIGCETVELRRETQSLFIECALKELLIADGLSFEM